MGNLKQTELQRLKNRGKRKESLRIGREKIEQEDKTKEKVVRNRNHEKQHLATLKRLKRGDENELERKLRLEKVVS